MRLLIDIGNTRIKWAYSSGGELTDAGEVVHRDVGLRAVATFVTQLQRVPEAIYAVNVAGSEMEQAVAAAVEKHFTLPVQMLRTSINCGNVMNGYTSVEQLGADRWAALVGAWYQCRQAAVVVDVGTALTIDLVAADGLHRGGIIVPGLKLMVASLSTDTSDIGGFAASSKGPVPGDDWYGRDTLSAIERGALFSCRAVVQKAVDEFSGGGSKPRVFLTGGDAELLRPVLDIPVDYRPHLVLEGVQRLADGALNA